MAEAQVSAPSSTVAGNPAALTTPTAVDKGVAASDVAQTPPAEAPRVYEVKINNRIVKMTEEELKNRAILATGANERFEQAAEMSKRAQLMLQRLQEDPLLVFKDPSFKDKFSPDQKRAILEKYYHENYIEPETLSEEGKKLREVERKLKEREEQDQQREQETKSKEEQAAEQYMRQQVQQDIIKTMELGGFKTADGKPVRFYAARTAYWIKQNEKNGFNAPPELLVQQVKDERNQLVQDMVNSSSPEQLIEMFGEDLIKKLRKYDLGRLQAQRGMGTQSETKKSTAPKGKKTMSDVDDFFNNLRRTK